MVLPTALVDEDKVFNSGFWFKQGQSQQFYKVGLTDSEKKFFAVPPPDSPKVFQKGNYRFGVLVCYEAEHAPWTYFEKDSVDAILWPCYWGWTLTSIWNAERDQDRKTPIFYNMVQWQCPLIQANFAKNNLEGHSAAGPEGLSYVIGADNKVVHRGPHLSEGGFVVTLERLSDGVSIKYCRPL